jgi:H+/Cl- antiporter ClcA
MLVTTLLSNGSSLYSSGSVLVVLLLLRLLLVAYFFVDFPESDLVFDFFVGTGLAAVFINLSVENFAGWKFALTFAIIQKSYFAGFIVYLLINLVLVFSSAYIITQFAPAAAGSGIPEIKGYLNGNIKFPYFTVLCFVLVEIL